MPETALRLADCLPDTHRAVHPLCHPQVQQTAREFLEFAVEEYSEYLQEGQLELPSQMAVASKASGMGKG